VKVKSTTATPISSSSLCAGCEAKRKKQLQQHPNSLRRVNKDDLRKMMQIDWNKKAEQLIIKVRNQIIISAIQMGYDIIVDDTNLAPQHEQDLRQLAAELGANFEIKSFEDVPIEVCIDRDKKRSPEESVGEQVIRDMAKKFMKRDCVQAPIQPPPNPQLPFCVICDIDGTVARSEGRSPYDNTRVAEDGVRWEVVDVVKAIARTKEPCKVIFLSGRDEECRDATANWLMKKAGFSGFELLMRPRGDTRKDAIIKRELYENNIKGKYNVTACFDDRPVCIRLWLDLKLPVFDVGMHLEF
jgi:predicted kinase